jgi:hypothetical protein
MWEFTLFKSFTLYGLLALSLTSLIGAGILIIQRKWSLLIPLYFALPTLMYLIHPNITFDAPWMLRRYLFSFFPLTIFLTVYGSFLVHQSLKKRFSRVISNGILLGGFALLAGASFPALLFYGQTSFHSSLSSQASDLAGRFSSRDLLLIDKEVTGSGYQMLTLPLTMTEKRHAVYFFNPADLDRISTDSFEHVYLIVPKHKEGLYAGIIQGKENVGEFNYTNPRLLEPASGPLSFPLSSSHTQNNSLIKLR